MIDFLEAVSAGELKLMIRSLPQHTFELLAIYPVGNRHYAWIKRKPEHKKEK